MVKAFGESLRLRWRGGAAQTRARLTDIIRHSRSAPRAEGRPGRGEFPHTPHTGKPGLPGMPAGDQGHASGRVCAPRKPPLPARGATGVKSAHAGMTARG